MSNVVSETDVRVGDVWAERCGNEWRVIDGHGNVECVRNPAGIFHIGEWTTWRPGAMAKHGRLVSRADHETKHPERKTGQPVPESSARSACKEFCGMTYGDVYKDDRIKQLWLRSAAVCDDPRPTGTVWCSHACKAAKHPPLSTQGEAKTKCVCPAEPCFCKASESPSPAPPAKSPVCVGCRKSPCIEAYLLCMRGNWDKREPMGTSLTEAKLPGFIDRRMRRDEGIESAVFADAELGR